MKKYLIMFLVFFQSSSSLVLGAQLNNFIKCYTDVRYIKQEGEYIGVTLIIFNEHQNFIGVFQEAAGSFQEPILVNLILSDNSIKFELPLPYGDKESWSGTVSGEIITIKSNNNITHTLTRSCG